MSKNSLGEKAASDTTKARQGVTPQILTNVYGTNPPRAAAFNKGISDRAGAQAAQDAMRNAKAGDYHRSK